MGGPGSGRPRGGKNSNSSREAMRVGMIAARRLKASQPENCQACGEPGNGDLSWCCRRDAHDNPGERMWLCGSCLTGPMLPLHIEDFARSGTSNLGAAQRFEIGSGHAHGPEGDRTPKRMVV